MMKYFIPFAFILALIVSPVAYQFCYKPFTAKTKIKNGAAEILKAGHDFKNKEHHFRKAEEIFSAVLLNYAKNDVRAYNVYAEAYWEVREYDRAYQKLKESLRIDFNDPVTLKNMGIFFTSVPDNYFAKIHADLLREFKTKLPKKLSLKNKYDFALIFFCYSMAKDADNRKSVDYINEILLSK